MTVVGNGNYLTLFTTHWSITVADGSTTSQLIVVDHWCC